MSQNCQVNFKILLLSFADTTLYSCPQLYKCPSLSTAVASLLAHTPHSLTHTLHTQTWMCAQKCTRNFDSKCQSVAASFVQICLCEFAYCHVCKCPYMYVCVYVYASVWVCKSHCVHVLAMCGCHLTRSTFIFWPLIAWSEPASTAAAQQFLCMCVCEVRETRSRACPLACWPTKCNINTFGIMVLTQFKLQLCGLFNASNRLQCNDCSVLCRALLDNGYIGNWIGCA